MARRGPIRYFRKKPPIKKPSSKFILLDQFSVADINKWTALKDQFLKYHWDYYNELAYQRSKIYDKIKESIFGIAQKDFPFKKWQRAVKYKYALEPFSTDGSLLDSGGRFNIGEINPAQFPPFPALYFAIDKDTALQELLSQNIESNQRSNKLDPLDFALTSHSSIVIVSLSGSFNSIIDLREQRKLQPFVDLVKDFSIPGYLIKTAKEIGEREPELVQTVSKLMDSLSDPNWRLWPMQFDVPATSQTFGQLVFDAGVEGILYISKFTGKECVAIYPQNFDEGSFVQLDDDAPKETKIRRLDSKCWNEIQKSKQS